MAPGPVLIRDATDADATEGDGTVSAFDADPAGESEVIREIVPVEVVPGNLPVEHTISPATLIRPGTGG